MAPIFSSSLFDFLDDLAENNDRDWFQAHRHRYDHELKEPALAFISAVGPGLRAISPHLQAIPKVQGGSLFRIHRDVRFSKDKSPYKTHCAMHFRHDGGQAGAARDVHVPGYYLHLERGECILGVGVWRPASASLRRLREAIVDDPGVWSAAWSSEDFRSVFEPAGESLKRPPRGVPADHPLIEDLKRKDFIAIASFDDEEVLADDFVERFLELSRRARPLNAWICAALGVPF
ncbi:MAG: DUF2461 domain-containing protein [Acidobacteriota bacterium]